MKETLKKQRLFFISIIGIVVVSLVMGTTFAYQTITMNESEQRNLVLKAGVLDVSFETTNVIENTNMSLLADYTEADYLEFTVDNTASTADAAFKINLTEIEYGYTNSRNQEPKCTTDTCIVSEDFKYKIVEVDTDNSYDGNFSNLSSSSPYTEEYELTNYITIEKGTTKTYRLYLWLQETEDNQNSLENTYFMGEINITSVFNAEKPFENPYSNNTNSLAYNIINNAYLGLNGTRYVSTPPSKVAEETNSYDWEYGEEMYIPFDGEYISAITEDSTKTTGDFEKCLYGVWDDEVGDYVGEKDCTGIETSNLSCENAIGKYFFDDAPWEIYGPVDACVEDVPMRKVKPESVLSVAEDDYGESYYYRGNVKDNYLNFAEKCWRIVRIEGDGSVKIILEDGNTTCDNSSFAGNWSLGEVDFGFDAVNISTTGTFYVNSHNYKSTSGLKSKLESWLSNSEINTEKLKNETWCLGDNSRVYDYDTGALLTDSIEYLSLNNLKYGQFVYEAYKRLKGLGETPNATLKCNVPDQDIGYIGALTADEVVYAGAKMYEDNYSFYLKGVNNTTLAWWTLTPSYRRYQNSQVEDDIYSVNSYGRLSTHSVCKYGTCKTTSGSVSSGLVHSGLARPVITLKKGTFLASGVGTQSDPYVIE